jgi:hypothetical protein
MSGRWISIEHAWHETNIVNCPVCGRLILRRAWEFDGGDGLIRLCSPSCQELYETYWRPEHGVMAGRQTSADERSS